MRHIVWKIGFYAAALWAALTLNFLIPRWMPGNPVDILLAKLGQRGPVTPEARASIEALLGSSTSSSTWSQYVQYLGNLTRGDLGVSVSYFPASVGQIISQTLPWTIGLIGLSTLISFLLGVELGTLAGWKRGSWVDNLVPVTTMFQSVP